jgi:predicted transcriptional regulator
MKTERKLSDANLEIMKEIWQKAGEVTINDIFEAVNAGRRKKVKRATIQVQMRRLEAYGWLKHRVQDPSGGGQEGNIGWHPRPRLRRIDNRVGQVFV